MTNGERKADVVLEGGGVRGLGSAGAVIRLLEDGYTFPRAAGTSVGAIAAALVAAGVGAKELRGIMDRLDSLLPTAPVVWLLLVLFVGSG